MSFHHIMQSGRHEEASATSDEMQLANESQILLERDQNGTASVPTINTDRISNSLWTQRNLTDTMPP